MGKMPLFIDEFQNGLLYIIWLERRKTHNWPIPLCELYSQIEKKNLAWFLDFSDIIICYYVKQETVLESGKLVMVKNSVWMI